MNDNKFIDEIEQVINNWHNMQIRKDEALKRLIDINIRFT